MQARKEQNPFKSSASQRTSVNDILDFDLIPENGGITPRGFTQQDNSHSEAFREANGNFNGGISKNRPKSASTRRRRQQKQLSVAYGAANQYTNGGRHQFQGNAKTRRPKSASTSGNRRKHPSGHSKKHGVKNRSHSSGSKPAVNPFPFPWAGESDVDALLTQGSLYASAVPEEEVTSVSLKKKNKTRQHPQRRNSKIPNSGENNAHIEISKEYDAATAALIASFARRKQMLQDSFATSSLYESHDVLHGIFTGSDGAAPIRPAVSHNSNHTHRHVSTHHHEKKKKSIQKPSLGSYKASPFDSSIQFLPRSLTNRSSSSKGMRRPRSNCVIVFDEKKNKHVLKHVRSRQRKSTAKRSASYSDLYEQQEEAEAHDTGSHRRATSAAPTLQKRGSHFSKYSHRRKSSQHALDQLSRPSLNLADLQDIREAAIRESVKEEETLVPRRPAAKRSTKPSPREVVLDSKGRGATTKSRPGSRTASTRPTSAKPEKRQYHARAKEKQVPTTNHHRSGPHSLQSIQKEREKILKEALSLL